MPKVRLIGLFVDFFVIGLTTLGGGYAIVPQVLNMVEKKRLMSHEEFQRLFSMSQLAPGPVGINLPILIGGKLRGIAGALVGFWGIILAPMAFIFMLVSWLETIMEYEVVGQIMTAVRIAVSGVILSAGVEMFSKTKLKIWEVVIFVIMLTLIFFTGFNAVSIIILGFLMGVLSLGIFEKSE